MSQSVKCLWLFLLAACVLAPAAGCDSKASKMAAMRRAAIRRSSDDDEGATTRKKEPQPAKVDDAQTTKKSQRPAAKPKQQPVKPKVVVEAPPERTAPASETERRQWGIDNLQTIALAMLEYREERGLFPRYYIKDNAGFPLLSWRVELLPFLGYQELYDKFERDQPWDSPQNMKLLTQIPQVYQSADRLDEKTNIMVPLGQTTMFPEDGGRVYNTRIEDKLSDIILLLEVDDELAVPWTKPIDFNAFPEPRGIGTKRAEGIFAAFGSGMVRRIPATVPKEDFLAALTIDGGEPVTMAMISHAVSTSPTRASDVDQKPYEQLATLGALGAKDPAASQPTLPGQPEVVEPEIIDDRPTAPPEASLDASRKLFRELYGPKYAEANSKEKKGELARELLEKSESLGDDPNGMFVLLQAARHVANEAQDLDTGLEIIAQLTQEFRLDDLPLKVELLKAMGTMLDDSQIDVSLEVAENAMVRDDFESASELLRFAASVHQRQQRGRGQGRGGDRRADKENVELTSLRKRVEAGRAEYRKFRKALETEQEGSPEAMLIAGRYVCFVKDDWLKGLNLLRQGSDETLRSLAELELSTSTSMQPNVRMQIAEGWWDYGKSLTEHRHSIWRHALLWYLAAEDTLPDGLLRVKAEMRINEAGRELGDQVLQELRVKMDATGSRRRRSADDDNDD